MTKRLLNFLFTMVFYMFLEALRYQVFETTAFHTATELFVTSAISVWVWEKV
jgi:hypothetical protein